MLTDEQFVQLSLINNLFYLRVIRYYSTNIQLSFYQNNQDYINSAVSFVEKSEELSRDIVKYANYDLLKYALSSQILVTKYTLYCEELTEKLFDIKFDKSITEQELQLQPGKPININDEVIKEIDDINQRSKVLAQNFKSFCENIYANMKNNELFSYSYLTLYQYMIEEVEQFIKGLERLAIRSLSSPIFVLNYEYRFNEVMRDGATFIRGYVDPSHSKIFNQANAFVAEFNELIAEYVKEELSPATQKELTKKSLDTLNRFIEFIERCIEGLLNKELYFIVEPIFLDNLYREANYFKYGLTLNQQATQVF